MWQREEIKSESERAREEVCNYKGAERTNESALLQLNNATREPANTHAEDRRGVSSRASQQGERAPCSARTSVAYGNGSCSKEQQLLVKMQI